MESKNELDIIRAEQELECTEEDALALDAEIKIHAQNAYNSLVEVAKGLKQMRDGRLYLKLGYETFGAYTEESLKIKERQAYTYIQSYENLGERLLQSTANLGITKVSYLARLPVTVREEFIEKNDLAGMTAEEVKDLVAQNDRRGEQISMLSDELEHLKDERRSLSEELERERSRPVEVAVAEPDEEQLKAIRDEAAQKVRAELEKKNKAEISAIKKQLEAEKKNAVEAAKAEAEKNASAQAAGSLDKIAEYKAQAEKYREEKERAVSKADELEKRLSIESSAETVKFTFYFDTVQQDINNILSALAAIRKKDSETAEKYSAAFEKYLEIVKGELNGKRR